MAQANHRQKTDADHNATTNRLNAMSVKVKYYLLNSYIGDGQGELLEKDDFTKEREERENQVDQKQPEGENS